MVTRAPERMTLARILIWARNFSAAALALNSWMKLSRALTITKVMMITASIQSCKKADKMVAKSRMRTIGLLNWLRKMVTGPDFFLVSKVFSPVAFKRLAASPLSMPLDRSILRDFVRSFMGSAQK